VQSGSEIAGNTQITGIPRALIAEAVAIGIFRSRDDHLPAPIDRFKSDVALECRDFARLPNLDFTTAEL
jgi:hypothetical protein